PAIACRPPVCCKSLRHRRRLHPRAGLPVVHWPFRGHEAWQRELESGRPAVDERLIQSALLDPRLATASSSPSDQCHAAFVPERTVSSERPVACAAGPTSFLPFSLQSS